MQWYVGNEWEDSTRGLKKKVLSLEYCNMEKPLPISSVQFKVEKCENLCNRPSKYLVDSSISHCLEMGTSVTPLDYYLEILLQQFLTGETSACFITTKSGEKIDLELKLERILTNKQVDKLNASEIYNLALSYKECGVQMFKAYPKFACDYFTRAAKLLITYKPFDKLSIKSNGINGSTVEALFVQVQTNLAACMLQEQRYEHVIYHTEFVETAESPTEKSIYRRALAYYHLKEFAKAQSMVERVPKWEEKKEFRKLKENIASSWKNSEAHYKEVVQRMFS